MGAHALLQVVGGPGNWISVKTLFGLQRLTGIRLNFKSLSIAAAAAKFRICSDQCHVSWKAALDRIASSGLDCDANLQHPAREWFATSCAHVLLRNIQDLQSKGLVSHRLKLTPLAKRNRGVGKDAVILYRALLDHDSSILSDSTRLLRRRLSRNLSGLALDDAWKRALSYHRVLHKLPACVVHSVLITLLNGWHTEARFQVSAPCICAECTGKDELLHFLGCTFVRQSFSKVVQRSSAQVWSTHMLLMVPVPATMSRLVAGYTFLLYCFYCQAKARGVRLTMNERKPLAHTAVQRLSASSRSLYYECFHNREL